MEDTWNEEEDGLPDRYIAVCKCPSIKLDFESETQQAQMCGTKKVGEDDYYKIKKITGKVNRYIDGPRIFTTTFTRDENGECDGNTQTTGSENCSGYGDGGKFYKTRVETYTGDVTNVDNSCGGTATVSGTAVRKRTKIYNESEGTCTAPVASETFPTATITIGSDCDFPCISADSGGIGEGQSYSGEGTITWSYQRGFSGTITGTVTADRTCDGGGMTSSSFQQAVGISNSQQITYEDELDQEGEEGESYLSKDTEEAALQAATKVTGTQDSSIWENRGGSENFTYQTSKYTATLKNLKIGKSYKGCVRLFKRTVDSEEPNGEFEEVEPDTIELTAQAEEVELEAIDLPIEQGYQYIISGYYIWDTKSPCNCPSEFSENED